MADDLDKRGTIRISETRGQTSERRYMGVAISRDSQSATIPARVALGLAESIKDSNPEAATELRKIATEVLSDTGYSHQDWTMDIEDWEDDPQEIALARRLLGIDPSSSPP